MHFEESTFGLATPDQYYLIMFAEAIGSSLVVKQDALYRHHHNQGQEKFYHYPDVAQGSGVGFHLQPEPADAEKGQIHTRKNGRLGDAD
jgi:hypothetical protein